MKILVKGNAKYYQSLFDKEKICYKNYVLEGDFTSNNSPIILYIYQDDEINKESIVQFDDKQHLFEFINFIRGRDLEMTQILLNSFFNQKVEYFHKPSLQENGMIKSLFIIYQWIEYGLSIESIDEIHDFMFNSFTIDFSGKLGSQSDIYFIDKKYEQDKFKEKVSVLMDVNLLCHLSIVMNEEQLTTTYFIPLIKPGVKREFFKKGNVDAYPLWKELINERNSSIHRFVNNN